MLETTNQIVHTIEAPLTTEATTTTFSEHLDSWHLEPIQIIQGGKGLSEFNIPSTAEISQRPFTVVQVINSDDGRPCIYKLRTEPDPEHQATNEIRFLKDLVTHVKEMLPDSLDHRLLFPQLVRYSTEYPYAILEEFFDGKEAGTIHESTPSVLNTQDVEDIAVLIKTLQTIPTTDFEGIDTANLPKLNAYAKYKDRLNKRAGLVEQAVGAELVAQVRDTLSANEDALSRHEYTFMAGDIQPSNIIKLKDGRLGMIDWEKIGLTNNPANDYTFMLTTLWNQPELLRAFFQKVMELHSDNPDFYERMRVDFISYRAPSEIFYWQGEKNKAASQPETDQIKIEQCDVAIKAIEGLLRDALSKQDLWSPIAV